MKKILLLLLLITPFCISCKRTVDVIEIKQETNSSTVQFIYSTRYKKITNIRLYLVYKINNSSFVDRCLQRTYHKSDTGEQGTIYRSLNETSEQITPKSLFLKNGVTNRIIVSLQPRRKSDSIITLSNLSHIPDSIRIGNSGDTLKYYKYQQRKHMPELLEHYLNKDDSITFEFRDYNLPFYVKRSKIKRTFTKDMIAQLSPEKQLEYSKHINEDGDIKFEVPGDDPTLTLSIFNDSVAIARPY